MTANRPTRDALFLRRFADQPRVLAYLRRRAAQEKMPVTVVAALVVLGIGERARVDRTSVLAAHRVRIVDVHPDAGGDTARAAKVNHARDVALAWVATTRT